VVFVSLLDTGTLARLEQSQSRSQKASVPECNSGGLAELCALGVTTLSLSPMSPRATSLSAIAFSPVAFSAVGVGGLRADSRKPAVGID
jgi:hypothetical protein